ncbi:Rifampin resistance, IMV assembly [Sheeppox virus]|uniref:62 kDa protein n=2 Tax=Sheeppox virus TaxID=10266 RepID=A0A3F2YKP6_SHEVT|nr:Rifampin resistance, IMV assembly [Sheeppox virus]AOE46451.1 rifampin resistance protein [Sheeppox virus]AOE46600.1 rifampin resistance protein [Sheeppox virus]AVI09586.1 Rifampin resistance, IMV assembly [Sheeppox virus]AVI09720.1 Rifampin resistance, IMV assembly [Sheeppox virus]QEJ79689.1 rifampicin target [Sheeppox virus]
MNNTVINSLIGNDDNIKRHNVFGVDIQNPTLYMPQYITLNSVSSTGSCTQNVVSTFEIRDQYITALSHLMLSIDLPEVKGIGKFGYVTYVGYKSIQHVSISCNNGTIWESPGEDLFYSCKDNETALNNSGFCHELNSISTGLTNNDTIKESATIYVYIKTPFDMEKTFSSLKLSDSKVIVTITFNPVSDIIIRDSAFDYESFVKDFIYVTELSFIGYMVKNIQTKESYIEIPRRVLGQINQSTAVISEINSVTSFSVYVKPYYGNTDNKFIAYPGYTQSERDFICVFVERLLEDLVVVSKEPPNYFPESAEFIEVPPNGIVNIQDVDVFIKIDNVPCGMSIYYHSNILVFGTRKNSITYNISKKFSTITGSYSESTKRIMFSHISHSISITDVSIPVNLWSCQRNVYNGDNRSESSKNKDLFINDPFIRGIDFKNKTDIISRMEVRFGNDVLYSETNPISKIYNDLLSNCVLGTRTLKFNFTPHTFFKPTTIVSNTARGKDKLSVRVIFSSFDPNNPIYYVSKQIVLVCNDLYKVTNENGINVIKITEE